MLFCRNLLIYLAPPARVCVMNVIDRLLAVDGLLLIGHADRLDRAGTEAKFTAYGDPACFMYRRTAHGDVFLPQPQVGTPRLSSLIGAAGAAARVVAILPESHSTIARASHRVEYDSCLIACR